MRKLKRHVEQMLYSASDVATMIGFSRSKTYEMIREGSIPHTLIGGRIRVRRSDLDAWINGDSRQR